MIKQSLFNLQSFEAELQSALSSSTLKFNDSVGDVDFWAATELRRNVENQIKNWAQGLSENSGTNCCGDPPGSKFKVTFGIQVQLNYKVRFKANLNIGYGQRFGDFGATTSFHVSAYNSGLGTSLNKSNLVVDVTAAANLTVGSGHGTPLQSYSLNYNSPIPMLNDFKKSVSYGQLFTWNSELNENKFTLHQIQREGMIGFRLGDFNVSSNNDTKRYYFGDGGDKGWTGGLTIATPLLEVGFQDFSGDFNEDASVEKDLAELEKQIKKVKNSTLSKDEKKAKIVELNQKLRRLINDNLHTQTNYQKKLNKASTYFRINNNGYNTTIDVIGDAWLQNFIHRIITKGLRFEYEHQKIELWGGKSW